MSQFWGQSKTMVEKSIFIIFIFSFCLGCFWTLKFVEKSLNVICSNFLVHSSTIWIGHLFFYKYFQHIQKINVFLLNVGVFFCSETQNGRYWDVIVFVKVNDFFFLCILYLKKFDWLRKQWNFYLYNFVRNK